MFGGGLIPGSTNFKFSTLYHLAVVTLAIVILLVILILVTWVIDDGENKWKYYLTIILGGISFTILGTEIVHQFDVMRCKKSKSSQSTTGPASFDTLPSEPAESDDLTE